MMTKKARIPLTIIFGIIGLTGVMCCFYGVFLGMKILLLPVDDGGDAAGKAIALIALLPVFWIITFTAGLLASLPSFIINLIVVIKSDIKSHCVFNIIMMVLTMLSIVTCVGFIVYTNMLGGSSGSDSTASVASAIKLFY